MNTVAPNLRSDRNLVRSIDRALVRLVEERARVLGKSGPMPDAESHRQDLARRASGAFPAEFLERLFTLIDAGCEEASQ